MLEHGRAIASDVFIEQGVSVSTAQQSRQRGLAVENPTDTLAAAARCRRSSPQYWRR
jgi:hypothetical protein